MASRRKGVQSAALGEVTKDAELGKENQIVMVFEYQMEN